MQPRASFIYKYFLLSYPPLPTLQLRRKLKLDSIIPAEDIEFLMLFLSVTVNIATFPWEFFVCFSKFSFYIRITHFFLLFIFLFWFSFICCTIIFSSRYRHYALEKSFYSIEQKIKEIKKKWGRRYQNT